MEILATEEIDILLLARSATPDESDLLIQAVNEVHPAMDGGPNPNGPRFILTGHATCAMADPDSYARLYELVLSVKMVLLYHSTIQ